jgi:hypothetical protein
MAPQRAVAAGLPVPATLLAGNSADRQLHRRRPTWAAAHTCPGGAANCPAVPRRLSCRQPQASFPKVLCWSHQRVLSLRLETLMGFGSAMA